MAGITGTQTEVLKGRVSLFLADLRSSIPTLVTLIILTYLLIGFILEILEPSRPNQTTPHWTMLWSRSGRGTLPNHTKTNQAQFLQCFFIKTAVLSAKSFVFVFVFVLKWTVGVMSMGHLSLYTLTLET